MARDRRLPVRVLLGGMALAVAILAWPWLRAYLITPLTLVVWLLLRVLVLPVHQAVYWTALVCAIPVLLWITLRRRAVDASARFPPARFARAHPVETWRWLVEQTASGARALPAVGWNGFVQLTVSLEALERRVAPDYLLHDALRSGQVPLPPEVHAFLFPRPPARPRRRAARLARWLGQAPRRALHRLSGRDRAERLRSMSRLLSFLEDSLEMTCHDDPDEPAHR